jgi:hypothetical protein
MRKAAVLLVALLVLACSSTNSNDNARIELVQMSGPAEQNWPFGRFFVQYGLRVTNRTKETITLRQIALEQASPGGPYVLVRDRYQVPLTISPGATEEATFQARAIATGNQDSVQAQAPVSVRAVAYFNAPSGEFRALGMFTFR